MNVEYLKAKQTVDRRSYHEHTRKEFLAHLPENPNIFEAGAGTGVMARRLANWQVSKGSYVGVDQFEPAIEYAREQGNKNNTEPGQPNQFEMEFHAADALDFNAIKQIADVPFDAVIAQQFMDLVDISEAMNVFEQLTKQGGLIYLPLTFDGVSIFRPGHPADIDILSAYHKSMDDNVGQHSQTGRLLIDELTQRSGRLLSVGGSDAVIHPVDSSYSGKEKQVIDQILEYIERSVSSDDVSARDDWVQTRREQLSAGDLTYISHRYDILYESS